MLKIANWHNLTPKKVCIQKMSCRRTTRLYYAKNTLLPWFEVHILESHFIEHGQQQITRLPKVTPPNW